MKLSSIFLPFAAAALIPAVAHAGQEQDHAAHQEEAQAAEASIPFANHGGVRNWRADGDRTVYFQDSHQRWYKAELMSRANGLPFANAIGIDAGGTGRLDRFGAIVVEGQRYPFTSFVRVDGPPAKKAKSEKAG
mgnify:CR=1 FL=1